MANTTKTYFYRKQVYQAESFDAAIVSLRRLALKLLDEVVLTEHIY